MSLASAVYVRARIDALALGVFLQRQRHAATETIVVPALTTI